MKTSTQFHKLPREVRRDRRRQAFRMLKTGYSKEEIASLVEVHISTIYDWINRQDVLKEHNYSGLKRGNPTNQRYLSQKQEKEILQAIKTSTPNDHGVEYYLWSRKAIGEFLSKKFNVSLVPQGISKYTKRWGLSSQRPSKEAYEQDSDKINNWLKNEYPKIQKRAKKEGAVIHWGDETSININTNYQKTYAPKGKTPKVKIPARKTSYGMVSSLTNQGKLRYMLYRQNMNANLFKVFLKRLIRDTDKKIFLIVDNLRVHHAKIIQKWQGENKEKIEIFFPTSICSTV
jgi:transposase